MAAHAKFPVEVLTPEGEVFNEEVEMVSTRTTLGEIGILANHAPLLAMLEPTELRLYRSDTEIVRFAQSEGYIQVGGQPRAAAGRGGARAGLARRRAAARAPLPGRAELETAGDDTERRRVAERDAARWEAFLRVAEGV